MDKIRSKEWYRKQYPKVNEWLNQCIICQMEGYKPELNKIKTNLAMNIKSQWDELDVNDLKICKECNLIIK